MTKHLIISRVALKWNWKGLDIEWNEWLNDSI